jgi:hypothetical protein
MYLNINTSPPILVGWNLVVYHFCLQFPVVTIAYEKKLRCKQGVLFPCSRLRRKAAPANEYWNSGSANLIIMDHRCTGSGMAK